MAYIKNNWVDQEVERPRTYQMTNNSDGSVTLIDDFGLVTELGTPVNADYMNHIEEGIEGCAIRLYNATETFALNEWVKGSDKLYKSKQNSNTGHATSDTDWWEEVSLGGGGLEICDIGIALFIDESKGLRRWINGQLVVISSNEQGFLKRLKQIRAVRPQLFDTEENWQAEKLLSVYGQVGKFVIADDESTVRLPAVVNIQGLLDLQKLGLRVDAGLPNITGSCGVWAGDNVPSGAYKDTGKISGTGLLSGTALSGVETDASELNPIYGNSETVQIEAIQYPYFIQIATGQETKADIINTLELNNPYTLFDCKYSETKLYNTSWLRSDSQYNAKALYLTAFEALQVEYNSEVTEGSTVELPSGSSYTKRGLSVKLSTEEYTDYDFVLNTTDETFRLPIKSKLASSNFAKGNGMALGLTDGVNDSYLVGYKPSNGSSATLRADNGEMPSIGDSTSGSIVFNNNVYYGINTDPEKSGIELCSENLYLYYYVGETIQNTGIINAGRIEEKMLDIIPDNKELITSYSFPSDKYDDLELGTSGETYVAPADGWYCIHVKSSVTDAGVFIQTDYGLINQSSRYAAGKTIAVSLGVSKGDTVFITFDGTLTLTTPYYFRFYYAKGVSND